MRSWAILCFVLAIAFAQDRIRPGPDPFQEGTTCNQGISKAQYVVDPDYCDRVLVCPPKNGLGYVTYCPAKSIWAEDHNACVLTEDYPEDVEKCQARHVKAMETPGKPEGTCHENPSKSETEKFHE